jgi:hypothetical protein
MYKNSLAKIVLSATLFCGFACNANDGAEGGRSEEVKGGAFDGEFGFGAGIGVNYLGGAKDINNARVTDGTIEVGDSIGVKTQLWLETHYRLGDMFKTLRCTEAECNPVPYDKTKPVPIKKNGTWQVFRKFGWGPFFAVQVGDDNSIINGAALGVLISLNKSKYDSASDTSTSRAFNIGIGVSTQRIQGLALGLREGDAVGDETQVTYKNYNRTGVLLLFSTNIF